MSTSDSDLSTPPATDDEMPAEAVATKATMSNPQKKKKKNGLIVNYFATKDRSPSPPPRKKRAPSPPHEPVPEDNFDIAVCICRVRRVESRCDRNPTARNTRVESPLTYPCHSFLSCSDRVARRHSQHGALIWGRRISSEALLAICHLTKSRRSFAHCLGWSTIARSLLSEFTLV